MSNKPVIYCLSASFGHGHTTAAKNLAQYLAKEGVGSQVTHLDPCSEVAPKLSWILNKLYRFATIYTPFIWRRLYHVTENCNLSHLWFPGIKKIKQNLRDKVIVDLEQGNQVVIISTYPIYAYWLQKIRRKYPDKIEVHTLITDSLHINNTWLKAKQDSLLVTDKYTARRINISKTRVDSLHVTGFPVSEKFFELTPLSGDAPMASFDILFFANRSEKESLALCEAIFSLNVDMPINLTMVLGENFKRLYKACEAFKKEHPGKVKLKTWTKKVPELMSQHHLVLAKAGGATVHEAIAAQCPMLVCDLVPGQEEGNLELLERIGAGHLANTPMLLRLAVEELLKDDAKAWRVMKQSLANYQAPKSVEVVTKLIQN